MSESEQCVFCLDDMNDESLTIMLDGCNHVVHTSCFLSYVKYNISKQHKIMCPVCRHIVVDMPMVVIPQVVPEQPAEPTTVYDRPPPAPAEKKNRWRFGAPVFIAVMGAINLICFLVWDAAD
jgi:hypothetical protein